MDDRAAGDTGQADAFRTESRRGRRRMTIITMLCYRGSVKGSKERKRRSPVVATEAASGIRERFA